MFRRRGLVGLLGTLFLIAVLVIAGVTIYRSGFSQGYLSAAAVEGAQPDAAVPGNPGFGYFVPYPGFFPWGPAFGLLVGGGFLLFFLLGIGRFFLFRSWARGRGPWGSNGPRGPMHKHGWPHWQDPEGQMPEDEPQEA
jgi:hypothetical protein